MVGERGVKVRVWGECCFWVGWRGVLRGLGRGAAGWT